VISCHETKYHLSADIIISPEKICQAGEKRYHNKFWAIDIYRNIADLTTAEIEKAELKTLPWMCDD
jgi:hypothetical protein